MATGGLLNKESALMGHQYNHFVSLEPPLRIRVIAARKHSENKLNIDTHRTRISENSYRPGEASHLFAQISPICPLLGLLVSQVRSTDTNIEQAWGVEPCRPSLSSI